MLTSQDFKNIEKQASKIYSGLELEIIQEIAERIANVGYANTVVYNNTAILQEMGVLYEDVISSVAKYNETSVSQIKKIFDEAITNLVRAFVDEEEYNDFMESKQEPITDIGSLIESIYIKEKIVYIKDSDLLGFDSSSPPAFQFNIHKLKQYNLFYH